MKAFHNSINVDQPTLELYEASAQKQDELVLSIYQEKKGEWLSPPYVHAIVKARTGRDIPITSIRRAITNLTKSGKLVKSMVAAIKGPWGVKTHTWTLAI